MKNLKTIIDKIWDSIKMKTRIIKRTNVDKTYEYVIQQKHFLFRWCWVDAWINSSSGAYCTDSFSTYEEAKKNICYFDDSKPTIEILIDNEKK